MIQIFTALCDRAEIEQRVLNIRIRDLSIYQEALLHKSAVKLYGCERSNERLEFIGDSVLNLIIARYLYDKYPNENEGFMTKLRTRIVSGKCLSEIARNMGLHNHIRMNEKALKQGWNENPRILEDVFESLIGAIYLDQGMCVVIEFVMTQLNKYLDFNELLTDTNYKDILMRYTQTNGIPLPVYTIVVENGPNHNKMFSINAIVSGEVIGYGSAKSKKQAEQLAAKQALAHLNLLPVTPPEL